MNPHSALKVRVITSQSEFEIVDKIYQTCFGINSVPTEIQYQWWQKFSKGIIGLFVDNKCIGAMSYWTLNPIGYDLMSTGSIKENWIKPEYIDPIFPKGIYISEIALLPQYQKKGMSNHLFQHFQNQILSNKKLPVLALAYSTGGKRILEKEGFKLLLNASQTLDNMPLYLKTHN